MTEPFEIDGTVHANGAIYDCTDVVVKIDGQVLGPREPYPVEGPSTVSFSVDIDEVDAAVLWRHLCEPRLVPLPYNPHRHGMEAWDILLGLAVMSRQGRVMARPGNPPITQALRESCAVHIWVMCRNAAQSLALRCCVDDLSWVQSGGLG